MLTGDQKVALLKTLYHEYQHANDGYFLRKKTGLLDFFSEYGISKRHLEIFNSEHNVSKDAIRDMLNEMSDENKKGCY